ncbi:MAG: hypothetical protein ABIH83_02070 [Candidatus Micrarchaeota archaeon]
MVTRKRRKAGRKAGKATKARVKKIKRAKKGGQKLKKAKKTKAGRKIRAKKILKEMPASEEKKIIYRNTARFYSLPVQLNLVINGTPFHLITHPFVRFHAVQSTIIGWKFSITYSLLIIFSLLNIFLFKGVYLEWLVLLFAAALIVHSLISIFLINKTEKGKVVALPIMGRMARRIAMVG